jgi:hypothetical protein
MVEQEDQIKNDGKQKLQNGQNPDDQREQHTEEDQCAEIVLFG